MKYSIFRILLLHIEEESTNCLLQLPFYHRFQTRSVRFLFPRACLKISPLGLVLEFFVHLMASHSTMASDRLTDRQVDSVDFAQVLSQHQISFNKETKMALIGIFHQGIDYKVPDYKLFLILTFESLHHHHNDQIARARIQTFVHHSLHLSAHVYSCNLILPGALELHIH